MSLKQNHFRTVSHASSRRQLEDRSGSLTSALSKGSSDHSGRQRPAIKTETSEGIPIRDTPAWVAERRSSLPPGERGSLRDCPMPADILEAILSFAPDVEVRFVPRPKESSPSIPGTTNGDIPRTNSLGPPRGPPRGPGALGSSSWSGGVRLRPVARVLRKRTRAVPRVRTPAAGPASSSSTTTPSGANSKQVCSRQDHEDAAPEPTAEDGYFSMSIVRAQTWERRPNKDNFLGVIGRATFRGTTASEMIGIIRSWDNQCALNPSSKLVFRESGGRRMLTAAVELPSQFPSWLATDRATFSDTRYFVVRRSEDFCTTAGARQEVVPPQEKQAQSENLAQEEQPRENDRPRIDQSLHVQVNLSFNPRKKPWNQTVNPAWTKEFKQSVIWLSGTGVSLAWDEEIHPAGQSTQKTQHQTKVVLAVHGNPGGTLLVTRDRADHLPTEIPQMFTHFTSDCHAGGGDRHVSVHGWNAFYEREKHVPRLTKSGEFMWRSWEVYLDRIVRTPGALDNGLIGGIATGYLVPGAKTAFEGILSLLKKGGSVRELQG